MIMNWPEFLKDSTSVLGNLLKDNPDLEKALGALDSAAKSKNALDDKTRELIALAVAATTRCDTCIVIHAAEAAKAGASRDELIEALSMAVALNTGAAAVYSSRILDAFDKLPK